MHNHNLRKRIPKNFAEPESDIDDEYVPLPVKKRKIGIRKPTKSASVKVFADAETQTEEVKNRIWVNETLAINTMGHTFYDFVGVSRFTSDEIMLREINNRISAINAALDCGIKDEEMIRVMEVCVRTYAYVRKVIEDPNMNARYKAFIANRFIPHGGLNCELTHLNDYLEGKVYQYIPICKYILNERDMPQPL